MRRLSIPRATPETGERTNPVTGSRARCRESALRSSCSRPLPWPAAVGRDHLASRLLRERIAQAFDEEGIEIPFPQQTVWHRADGMAPVAGG
jgi:hypothetical protein